MKNLIRNVLIAAATALAVCCFTNDSAAQDGPDRDRQLERYRERLEVKSDHDWKKLKPIVAKVMEAQREAHMGVGGPDGPGGRLVLIHPGEETPREVETTRNLSPEVEALQKALDGKASDDEVKEKLAKVRAKRDALEGTLRKAQVELQKALSPRQEAAAVIAGLLK